MNAPNANIPRAYLLHNQTGFTLPIGDDGLRIGRHSTNHIVIPENRISRFHAHLYPYYGRFWIRDLGSATGVFINGYRIQNQAEISFGDKITIGSATFTFQRLPAVSSTRAAQGNRLKEKKNALVYLGILATALLILITAVSSGGGAGSPKGTGGLAFNPIITPPALNSAAILWGQNQIDVSILTGTSQAEMVSFQVTGNLPEASLVASPEIANLVQFVLSDLGDLEAGKSYQGELMVSSFETAPAGVYTGYIQVFSQNQPLQSNLPVIIRVNSPDSSVIPPDVSMPSPDKIVPFSPGHEVVKDLLVVGLDLETLDAETRIRQIAAETGGVFIGSIPQIFIYQIRYPTNSLDELEKVKQRVSGLPDVSFASREFFGNFLQKIPNDKLYENDSWTPSTPSGPNWHLEMLNAPAAWDLETGDPSVKIGVVDVGIVAGHGDLKNNILTSHGKSMVLSLGHGTHVSGLIAAEGNNAKGVSGMMWDASLQTYNIDIYFEKIDIFADIQDELEKAKRNLEGMLGGRFSTTDAAEQMTQAVLDGNRIINLSFGVGLEKCQDPVTQEVLDIISESKAVYSQVILYGMKLQKDILWVIAAGNECTNARNSAPANLVENFPLNVIAVASVNQNGELSDFSNRGDLVSVAAPGGNDNPYQAITSTIPNCLFEPICLDEYGEMKGTSMAAPIVSGIAGLVLAHHPDYSATQIKQCILAGAKSRNHLIEGQPFYLADAELAVKCEGELSLPDKVDIMISIDLTHSMEDELQRVKREILQVIDDLRQKASPSTEFRFGVVSFEDYPGRYDSSKCGTSGYDQIYGTEFYKLDGDAAFRLEQPLTEDHLKISEILNRLSLGDGQDVPESYGRVFWEVGMAAIDQRMNFRPDAKKLLLSFGDSLPHDPDLNEGISSPTLTEFDTGIDPGPDGVIDCVNYPAATNFDLDFQDSALQALVDGQVQLLHVDSSGESGIAPYWQYWVSQTGGAFKAINPDGSIPGGLSLSELIMQLLELSTP